MKHLILCAVLTATKWFTLAPAAEDEKKPDPPAPPPAKGCQCGCGKLECKCGRTADQAMTCKPSAHVIVPDREIWLFAPLWCGACKRTKILLGTGDQKTRLVVKEKEAHFTPRKADGSLGTYPLFYDPVGLKQWSGQPKDMDELRRIFGIKPGGDQQ
jgi:hypothetical protein